jgi:transcriptional regulator with XRE-family HTH domain
MRLSLRHAALIQRRKALGLSQKKVAALAGIPANDVWAIEALRWGDVSDVKTKAQKLAAGLDLPVDVVLPLDAHEVSVSRSFTRIAQMDIATLAQAREQALPLDAASRNHAFELVREAVDALPATSALVLRKLWGLDDDHQHTMKEVGVLLGRSRERVRQLECHAIHQLRRASPGLNLPGNKIAAAAAELDLDTTAVKAPQRKDPQ